MERIAKEKGIGAMALRFAILTAARSGEVRGATWSEIDLDAAVWAVPAARMKAGVEHRVPLSPAAVALLRSVEGMSPELVFPSPRSTIEPLSDMTLLAVLRRLKSMRCRMGSARPSATGPRRRRTFRTR